MTNRRGEIWIANLDAVEFSLLSLSASSALSAVKKLSIEQLPITHYPLSNYEL